MPLDMEAVQQKIAEYDAAQQSGPIPTFSETEGHQTLRIIPPFGSRKLFYVELLTSFSVGPNKKAIVLPSQFGLPDPLMDHINALREAGDEASLKRANAMRPKKRAVLWVVVRDVNGSKVGPDGIPWEAKGPMRWRTNIRDVIRDLLAFCNDPNYGDITHVEEGHDIGLTYTPKGKTRDGYPSWRLLPVPSKTPLGDPSWVAEDLFEKYDVEKPTDHDYIVACIEGRDKEFNEERKRARADGAAPAAAPTNPQPPQEDHAAAAAALEKIRRENAAAGRAAGLTNRVMVPNPGPAAPPPLPGSAAALLADRYWAGLDGGTRELSGKEVQAYVDAGHGDALQIMSYDQTSGWKTATAFGFKKGGAEQAPAPPGSSVTAELNQALK